MEKGILAPYVACDEHKLRQGLVPLLPSQGRKLLEKVGAWRRTERAYAPCLDMPRLTIHFKTRALIARRLVPGRRSA